ncbi:hypothetical protein HDU90_007635 [Geranomyces variabilis]|nr:hypothetical protein HDU90_007635 [Geranomyces variabilis]
MPDVDGDIFVRSLATDVRARGSALLDAARTRLARLTADHDSPHQHDNGSVSSTQQDDSSTLSPLAARSLLSSIGLSSFASAVQPSAATPKDNWPGDDINDSAAGSTFALDPYHLEYLDSVFKASPLVGEYIADSKLNGHVPNILPSPITPGKQSRSANYLSAFWPRANGAAQVQTEPEIPLDEEVLYLYKFFVAMPVLRLAPVRRNTIAGFSPSSPPAVNLTPFYQLAAIEFDAVHPHVIACWGEARDKLRSLSCRYALKSEHDLVAAARRPQLPEEGSIVEPSAGEDDVATVLFPLLTHLYLAGNSLSSITATLTSHIPRCAYLNLSSNALTTVPSTLASLSELSVVDLSANRIASISDAGDSLRNVSVLLLKNNALENLLGVESLARLKCLDVSENKIWDVYEVGRLAVLMDVAEIWIADNPLTKLPNYRINIYTYFKERALRLLLDGTSPSAAEQRDIQANMTVAAVPTAQKASSGNGKSGSKARSTAASRDASNRDDKKSTTSGRRSVVSGNKEERRRRKKSVQTVSEAGVNESLPPKDTVVPPSAMHSISENVSPAKEANSAPSSPSVQRRMQRLAELERTVGATAGATDDQVYNVDSADLIVSRAAKKVTKTKVKKPKISAKGNKADTPGADTHSSTVDNAPPASALNDRLTADQKSTPHSSLDSFSTALVSQSRKPSLPATARIDADPTQDISVKESASHIPTSDKPDINVAPAPATEHVAQQTSGPVNDAPRPPLPHPPSPLQPAPTVGSHIGNIGPYRRIFQYESQHATDASSRSAVSNVKWVLPPGESAAAPARLPVGTAPTTRPLFPQRRISSGPDVEIGSRLDFQGVPGTTAQGGNDSAGPAGKTDSKGAPLPALWFGDRRAPSGTAADPSAAVRKQSPPPASTPPLTPALILAAPLRSNRTGSASVSTRSGGRSVNTAPAYSRLPTDTASTAGSGVTWASIPAWMVPRSHANSLGPPPVPSAPTLPFLTLSNALKLHLILHVLKDPDAERCLAWLPASCLVQLPASDATEHHGAASLSGGPAANGSGGRWFQFADSERGSWRDPSYAPAQRPCYILLTNARIYIFEPRYRFPFAGGRGDGAETRHDENIASLIRLVRCIRLKAVARVDVGPNRQYFVMRYYVPANKSGRGASAGGSPIKLLHPLDAASVGGGGDSRGGGWESVVVVTRDRAATTVFLDGFRESLRGGAADHAGVERPINECTDWAMAAIHDHVLTRPGTLRQVGPPVSWTTGGGDSHHHLHRHTGHAGSATVNGKWYERLLRGGRSAPGKSEASAQPTAKEHPPASHSADGGAQHRSKLAASFIADGDRDPAAGENDDYNEHADLPTNLATAIKTYLHVGLILVVPPMGSTQQSLSASAAAHPPVVSVRPLTLAATGEYIYLFTERSDVWPPLAFPPEARGSGPPAAWVNASVGQSEGNAKGLLADAVSAISRVIDVGKIAHLRRCERWRTWRWSGTGTSGEGGVVQNGHLGVWKRGRRAGGGGSSAEWGWAREGEGVVEGTAAGWSWWVRVVFADPAAGAAIAAANSTAADVASSNAGAAAAAAPLLPPMATPTRPPTGTEPMRADEHNWDLVFGSLDSANEFLSVLRDLGGAGPTAEGEEEYGSTGRAVTDGVEIVVGDD